MLRVNLLPDGARKISLSPIEQFHRTPLMWVILVCLSIVPLGLFVPMYINGREQQRVTKQIDTLRPKKEEVDKIQRAVQLLQEQDRAFSALKTGKAAWAHRLNILSNVTPDGVWFSELSVDQKKGLVLQGSAIAAGGDEITRVNKFLQELSSQPDFASAFNGLSSESIKRVQLKEVEVVQFTITGALTGSGS